MRALPAVIASLVCLLGAASGQPANWGPVIDIAGRFWGARDEAMKGAEAAPEGDPRYYLLPGKIKLHVSDGCVYWTGRFGHAWWETSGEVIYGNYTALSSIYAGLLSGEVKVKQWPEPYRSRMAVAVRPALA